MLFGVTAGRRGRALSARPTAWTNLSNVKGFKR
jgi:hypothetical protein